MKNGHTANEMGFRGRNLTQKEHRLEGRHVQYKIGNHT